MTIYVAKIKAFGEQIDALRIRAVKPAKPELTPSHKDWQKAKDAIKSGFSIEQLEKRYTISEETKKLLSNETIQN